MEQFFYILWVIVIVITYHYLRAKFNEFFWGGLRELKADKKKWKDVRRIIRNWVVAFAALGTFMVIPLSEDKALQTQDIIDAFSKGENIGLIIIFAFFGVMVGFFSGVYTVAYKAKHAGEPAMRYIFKEGIMQLTKNPQKIRIVAKYVFVSGGFSMLAAIHTLLKHNFPKNFNEASKRIMTRAEDVAIVVAIGLVIGIFLGVFNVGSSAIRQQLKLGDKTV